MAAMLAEYATTFTLADFTASAPPLYRVLAHQRRGVVAEVPVTDPGDPDEGRATYMSSFHWFPIVNGYSGNFPPSYLDRFERLLAFPDERALRQLHRDNVTYLIVHEGSYSAPRIEEIRELMVQAGMIDLGGYDDGLGRARLYRVR